MVTLALLTPTERSLMESTNTSRGVRHVYGKTSASGCTVIPKPGPEVRASPSFWYFGAPMAFRRLARVNA
jgi:hypothetical protein